jgi:steroid 5-alpha reductase family enzyme
MPHMESTPNPGPSSRRPVPRPLARVLGLFNCLTAYLAAGIAAAVVARLASGLPPVPAGLLVDLAATAVVFAFSLIHNNSSYYDPYWSVLPPLLALYWLLRAGARGVVARQALAGALLLAWAVRLTFNWARRWQGQEDWRYAGFRRAGAAYWPISFVGFHLMPTLVVFLGCLPLWPALTAGGRNLGLLDAAAALITAGAVAIEAAADRQLARFLRASPPGSVLDRGLWAWSRHPNYFGEVAFWWGLWLFGLAADPARWWTVAGPLCVTALFLGVSVPMMERHLAGSRPEYLRSRKGRSRFFPLPPRK